MGRESLVKSVLGILAVATVVAGCSDDPTSSEAPQTTRSSTSSSSPAATATSSEDMPLLPRVNSEAGDTTKVGLIGSVQTISGDGYTIRVQVKDPATIRRVSSSTVTVFVPVSIDVVDGKFDLNPTNWVLRTLSGQEVEGTTLSQTPTAIGKATVTGHVEGLIPFTDYSSPSVLSDEASLSLVQLVPDGSAGEPAGQWNWSQPTPIKGLSAQQ